MSLRSFIVLFIALLHPFFGFAQVSFSTITDELVIRLNGIVQVQYIVENATKIEAFEPPIFHDFKIMQGPMETSGMSLVNNQLTEYKALTYVLQPMHKGRLTVPGASAVINGKKMISNKVIVEVREATPPANNPYPRNPGISGLQESAEEDFLLGENDNASDKIKNNLIVKLDLDKNSAFVGEPIVATYKLYTRLRSESRVSKRPSMNGFSVYEMIDPYAAGPVIEKINGKPFMMHIIRKTQLIPLQDGSFVLEPVELENTVRFLRTNSKSLAPPAKSPLEKMFDDLLAEPNGEWEEHKITLSSMPRQINIRALPDGAPASFNGAVGNFSIQGFLKDSIVAAGENATYEVKIEGSGNLPLVNAPDWQLPGGFENFDPAVSEEINKTVAPMQGNKTFTYTFTTGSTGRFTLPPVEFSYFDPATQTYKSIQTLGVALTVTPGLKTAPTLSVLPQQDISQKNNGSKNNVVGALVFLLGMAGLVLLLRKKKKQTSVTAGANSLPEVIIKKDPLEAARQAAGNNQPAEFYRAVEAGLWEAIAEKMKLSKSALQKPLVLELLELRGLPPDKLQQLKDCWKTCEWALYVPNSENQVDPRLLKMADDVVKAITTLY
ncbi:BatD family protein [Flavihumibacter fluvii]|uniref:BatD family protein n=1 Tax=Flavihumibacter fluvii TaxID=2838157 RepID=UPI001BDE6628|nr:BatD family protein [Flavihumibacter fluvii]ULQ52294.1 BatD family protein [Flavihumibacter fluvii]